MEGIWCGFCSGWSRKENCDGRRIEDELHLNLNLIFGTFEGR
jgi:hypothetical protein